MRVSRLDNNTCVLDPLEQQVLLDENRHVSLTDTPPEDERTEEPEAGIQTQARADFENWQIDGRLSSPTFSWQASSLCINQCTKLVWPTIPVPGVGQPGCFLGAPG